MNMTKPRIHVAAIAQHYSRSCETVCGLVVSNDSMHDFVEPDATYARYTARIDDAAVCGPCQVQL